MERFWRLCLRRYSGTSVLGKGCPLSLALVVSDFGCLPAITSIIGRDETPCIEAEVDSLSSPVLLSQAKSTSCVRLEIPE
jgi:hypothetical protein